MKIKNSGSDGVVVLKVEFANGEPVNFSRLLTGLLQDQDMASWRRDPQEFQDWIRKSFAVAVGNLEYILE